MDGIEDNISTTVLKIFANHFGAIFAINKAVAIDIGTAIVIARITTIKVLINSM
jgi:hypothetical protein